MLAKCRPFRRAKAKKLKIFIFAAIQEQNRLFAGPPGMEPVHKSYWFQARWDNKLEKHIDKFLRKTETTLKDLIQAALHIFFQRYKKGFVDLKSNSDFLRRIDKKKKTTWELQLSYYERNMLRDLKFTLEKSMAECMRIALEWYIYVFVRKQSKHRSKYFFKNKFTSKTRIPAVIIFTTFHNEKYKMLMVDSVPNFSFYFY